ncbi:MAG: hypothetical protein AAF998_02770 [Bacteroidota bacterium]
MLENSFLTYDQLAERLPELRALNWSALTLESFHRARLILAMPNRSGSGMRFHIGDVLMLAGQATRNADLIRV